MPMKKYKKKKKMVVFTTTYSSEMGAIKEFLLNLGKKEVLDFEKEYQWRKLFGPWGLDILVKWYAGYKKEDLKKLSRDFHLEYLSAGFKDLVFELKEKGNLVGVINPNPQFMMDTLKENMPLDFAIGLDFEYENGISNGKIKRLVHRYIEVELLKEKRQQYGLNKDNVITIGRSSVNHVPIARESGIFVGFDPVKNTIKEVTKRMKANQDLNKIIF